VEVAQGIQRKQLPERRRVERDPSPAGVVAQAEVEELKLQELRLAFWRVGESVQREPVGGGGKARPALGARPGPQHQAHRAVALVWCLVGWRPVVLAPLRQSELTPYRWSVDDAPHEARPRVDGLGRIEWEDGALQAAHQIEARRGRVERGEDLVAA